MLKKDLSGAAASSTSSIHIKKKSTKAPLVSSEVRRCERLKVKQIGFKDDSCKTRDCFYCSIEPPTLSTKVIRNLGSDFCKISPLMMIDEALHKKASTSKTVVAKQSKKVPRKKNYPNEDKPSKKCKK
jgi:hypothetical protein